MKQDQNTSAKISSILLLRCPYCVETKLQKKGSWFLFQKGCESCKLLFEREEGYFAGASWMVNYTSISLFGIIAAILCAYYTDLSGIMIATVASISITVFGLFFFPFGNAIWIFADHSLHPINDKDQSNFDKIA